MTFKPNPQQDTLSAMLMFAEWRGKATSADVDALKDGLDTIRTAMVQPVGTSRAAHDGGVTEAEYDGAVMRVIAAAMVLYLSGALDTLCLG